MDGGLSRLHSADDDSGPVAGKPWEREPAYDNERRLASIQSLEL